jgi:hypothetical protein
MTPRYIPAAILLVGLVGCGEEAGVKGPPLTTNGPNQVLVKVAGMT